MSIPNPLFEEHKVKGQLCACGIKSTRSTESSANDIDKIHKKLIEKVANKIRELHIQPTITEGTRVERFNILRNNVNLKANLMLKMWENDNGHTPIDPPLFYVKNKAKAIYSIMKVIKRSHVDPFGIAYHDMTHQINEKQLEVQVNNVERILEGVHVPKSLIEIIISSIRMITDDKRITVTKAGGNNYASYRCIEGDAGNDTRDAVVVIMAGSAFKTNWFCRACCCCLRGFNTASRYFIMVSKIDIAILTEEIQKLIQENTALRYIMQNE